jgi:FtsH-binding integral membrane protein
MDNITYVNQEQATLAMPRAFLSNVFTWMGGALFITALVAFYFGTDASYMRLLVSETGLTTLGYVVMFAPLGFVLLMSFGFNRMSSMVLLTLFLVYSVVMGMSLSFIFAVYTEGSIFKTFGIAAGMFGVMAFIGYTTKTDLSKFGNIMIMGVVGLILASVVNMFLRSPMMDYIVSFFGVAIFTGLTAYDMQRLKRIGSGVEYGSEQASKLAVMGALSLYLDFVNLFLYLLRFFGNRK